MSCSAQQHQNYVLYRLYHLHISNILRAAILKSKLGADRKCLPVAFCLHFPRQMERTIKALSLAVVLLETQYYPQGDVLLNQIFSGHKEVLKHRLLKDFK